MKIAVFVGGNKDFSAQRLGVKLAEELQYFGKEVLLVAAKGKIKFSAYVSLKEYAATAKPKTLAAFLLKERVEKVISLMDLTGCQAAVEADIPFVYAETEGFKEDKTAKNKKTILKQAQQVLVIKYTQAALNKRTYAGLSVAEVQNPAVWVERYDYHKPDCFKKENNVLAIGKFSKESGFDTLLKTWARLAPAHPSWHLTLVGDGPSKTTFAKFIAKHNLQASVEMVSASGDTYSLLRNADIFAYPSINPVRADVLLDAMASKLPCVACESAAAVELITNGVNGVIVNAGEEEPFTIALDDMMVNWGKRVGIAVEAGKHKDRFPFLDFVKAFGV
ncbi:MAG: glycosyltransferase [Elusimicrobiaceae bacterium]|nr:glycosyltransferase [Elusimicrobiaceae bacterium]